MGISNGVYVGAKWAAGGDALAPLRKLQLERDVLEAQLERAKVKSEEAEEAIKKLPAESKHSNEEKEEAESRKKDIDAVKPLEEKVGFVRKAYKDELGRLMAVPASG